MSWHVKVIANRYADSVKLMGIARGLRGRDGVDGCEMGMGTAANLEALEARGVEVSGAGPSDLIVAVDAGSEETAQETLKAAEEELSSGGAASAGATSGGGADREPPRSLVSARRRLSDPNVALISVAGEYATLEAHRALSAGMHVFLFSDHVSLEDELELKQRGQELGLLVMGPGCGTAMLGNVGLGFANVVTTGPVGIVAAAGTGAQESACLLDAAGVGVSQIVGVGGRDLSADIGGIMFRQAMHMLAADDETETLLLVSKPPAPGGRRLAGRRPARGQARRRRLRRLGGRRRRRAVRDPRHARGRGARRGGHRPRGPQRARGAPSTRRANAPPDGACSACSPAARWRTRRSRCSSPSSARWRATSATGPTSATAATPCSTSARRSTRRAARIRWSTSTSGSASSRRRPSDESVGCVLLDVVLGHGGHTDPASGLSDAIAAAAKNAVVLARVCGTNGDPQDATRQTQVLRDAGAIVAPSNAAATRLALRAIAPAEVAA